MRAEFVRANAVSGDQRNPTRKLYFKILPHGTADVQGVLLGFPAVDAPPFGLGWQTKEGCNVRATPSREGKILGTLQQGEKVSGFDSFEQRGWVVLVDRLGYIDGKDVVYEAPSFMLLVARDALGIQRMLLLGLIRGWGNMP